MPRENLGESPPNGAGRRHPEQHRPPLDLPSAALTDHRLAGFEPEMAADEYAAFVANIAAHGLIEPIVTYEGQVLDGRHRYRACLETGTEPRFTPYEGDDPLGFVVSENLLRRHLSASQRAVLALDFESEFAVQAKERQGARTDLTSSQSCQDVEQLHAAERAAAMVGVSARLVSDAKRLRREAPERLAGVRAGEHSLHEAIKEGRHQHRRAAVEAATLDPPPLNEIGPFTVLYVDPPWRSRYRPATTRFCFCGPRTQCSKRRSKS
jgi:ParB-like chromosome segregation protein Spo0J